MSSIPFSLDALSPARLRVSLIRVPLASKALLAIIVAFWFANLLLGTQTWAQLAPDKVGFTGGSHRLSTYPFLHLGLFHTIVNILALAPMLEKFENEHGTIVTALMFTGPFSTFPGVLYTVICNSMHIKTPVQGASVWSFLLLTSTFYRAAQSTPFLSVPLPQFQSSASGTTTTSSSMPYRVPTIAVPFILIILTSILISHTSLLGHLCGALIGYGWGAGYLKFLAPPEKILRWIENTFRLKSRLPSSYISVDKGTGAGRYGVLPTDEVAMNGSVGGITGTGDNGRHI